MVRARLSESSHRRGGPTRSAPTVWEGGAVFQVAGGPHPRIAETLAVRDEGLKHRQPTCDCDEQAVEAIREYLVRLSKGHVLEAN